MDRGGVNKRVREIRERVEKATLGPWQFAPNVNVGGLVRSDTGAMAIAAFREDHAEMVANAEFIAHAREDIPYLLDRIEKLEEALRKLCEYADVDVPDLPDGDSVGWEGDGTPMTLTFGDIRRARALLSDSEEPG